MFISCSLSLEGSAPLYQFEPGNISQTFATKYSFPISESELRDLAHALAPKVDLFREIWEKDPEAEFFAGTTRDYLYWILGHFKDLESLDSSTNGTKQSDARREKVEAIKAKLLAIPFIKFNEIVGPESDADIMTKNQEALEDLRAEDFAIRKLDFISFDRATPKNPMYQDEIDQGFIPSEKIRLSKNGISTDQNFGNGVADLVSGNLSIQFPDIPKFWKTHYAKLRSNHPLLLALRYVRILAQDYLQRHGSEIPDAQKLEAPMSKEIKSKIKALIQDAIADTDGSFKQFLRNEQGKKWLNASIQKSFRSFTNANAAFDLMKELGILGLIEIYPNEIESAHQYLLKTKRNEGEIAENFKKFGIKPDELYEKLEDYLPDFELYHGTESELAFRNIIYQGVIPSKSGAAGEGLYGVSQKDLEYAKKWSKRKSRRDDLVIALKFKPTTKIVDITKGKGRELFNRWMAEIPEGSDSASLDLESIFAEKFGIDLLRYPYGDTEAFVLKNADIIEKRRGVFKNPRPLSELLSEAEKAKQSNDLSFLKDFIETPLTKDEKNKIIIILGENYFKKALEPQLFQKIKLILDFKIVRLLDLLLASPFRDLSSNIRNIVAFMNNPSDLIGGLIYDAVKNQRSWSPLFWNEVPTLLKDPREDVRQRMANALQNQSSWPAPVWNEIPTLLKDTNVYVREHMIWSLIHQSSWPAPVWNEVPTLLKDPSKDVRRTTVSALQNQSSWPSPVWDEVPSLLRDSHYDVGWGIATALKNQSSWPAPVWNEVPAILKDPRERVRWCMTYALKNQSSWPTPVWNAVPAILKDPNEDVRRAMALALKNQSAWPQNIITLVAQSTYPEFSELKTLKPSILDLSLCKNSISEIPDSKPPNNLPGEAKP